MTLGHGEANTHSDSLLIDRSRSRRSENALVCTNLIMTMTCKKVSTKPASVSYLRINFIVVLLSSHPPADDMIPNCVSKGKKVISRCSNISVFHQSVVEMPVERLFEVCNIFHRCNPADTNLLSFVVICDWIGRHDADHWA